MEYIGKCVWAEFDQSPTGANFPEIQILVQSRVGTFGVRRTTCDGLERARQQLHFGSTTFSLCQPKRPMLLHRPSSVPMM